MNNFIELVKAVNRGDEKTIKTLSKFKLLNDNKSNEQFVDLLNNEMEELIKSFKDYKGMWKKLKKWLVDSNDLYKGVDLNYCKVFKGVLNFMNDLEKGESNE